jgi:DNA-binding LacI/PurR family transcriptional regulator
MLLGVIVRDFSDPFFAAAIEALATEARGHGYNVILGHAYGDHDETAGLPAVIETRQTDAIILLGDVQDQTTLIEDLRASRVPIVALWQGLSPSQFPTADVDDPAGIEMAVQHLVSLGHRRIAFVSGRLPGGNPRREIAYVTSMRAHLGGVPDGYIQRVPNSLSGGGEAIAALLALPEPPTSVVCSTDLVAIGVLHSAGGLVRRVPQELSVVGFDDIALAAYTVPALTTLRMPVAEMVAEAVTRAVALARDPTASRAPRVSVFQPRLILRDSTAPPA